MECEIPDVKKFLLSKEEKKLFFKLKLKSKLDKSFMCSIREYLITKDIKEHLYSDDELIYCVIKGRKVCSK